MAEETNAPAVADAPKLVEEPTPAADAVAEPAVTEAKPAEEGIVATEGVAEVSKTDDAQEDAAAKEENTASAQPETEAAGDDADTVPASDAATNGTPAAKKTSNGNGKRKSGAGVPEHKKKTPAKGKKKAPELRLNVNPGEMYMVAMRGYQPWPVIICDEDMLPESLLSKRPVSAKRIDGTYREDFLEGGKNAKDRRYPVMFLGTNEFAWQVNTDLLTFNLEDVKKDVEEGNSNKKNKALWEAWQIAAEGHDLAHFKQVLASHEAALAEDNQQKEQKELEKKEKAEKSAKRKSTAAAGSDDVEMADGDDAAAPSAKKAKASKKRKKGEESDGENDKPAKTPKTKLKLTTKTPKDASTAKPKKETKSKKKASEEAESAQPEEPPLTEEERLAKREKQILYLRHRLQKGFLSRDQAPKDEDMANMSDYLKQLELHDDLEAEVIKKTKVHKVLKAIIKLNSIPKEEEYSFKQRSGELLTKWGGALASDGEPATNGVKHDDEKPTKEESPIAKAESPAETKEKKDDTSAEPESATKPADTDGDVTMADADKELNKDEPAIKADTESAVEASTEAATSIETASTSTEAITS
ncbi:hypothetical protein HBI56_093920 [Parastagonospora nodorum]|nr:hypothetical protein HBH52_019420 [Parastagonospora nodorum]KAH4941952.1 hypothetical protein HBH74_062760 [Parastagonospora nodorum]KAH4951578.1 hypothetical protein HBH73_103160 [Parastagonospora nodorum]KAH4994083.1 hypothetical protein HBI76_029790 [Parastagonospora nodorum]KAH5116885.1 hypothetical protein HBH71_116200 [Parastagonospora nodorum]